jgi:predicted glutamine amidotransferase
MVGTVFRGEFPVPILRDLQHVAQVGQVPSQPEPGHKDGWGMVAFSRGSPEYVGRSPRPAFLDPSFDSAVQSAKRLSAPNILIAHARAASRGKARMENTHPFIANGIALGHNGTVLDFSPRTSRSPRGDTDSERLTLLLADRVEEKGDLRAALRSVILEDVSKAGFTALVLLVSDGSRLMAYRDYAKAEQASYYDLKYAKCSDYLTFFQETVMDQGSHVVQVRKGELVSAGLDLEVTAELLA